MGEHDTWFHLLPGFGNVEAALAHALGKTMSGEEVHSLWHVVMALFVMVIVLSMAMRFRGRLAAAADGGVVPEAAVNVRSFFENFGGAILSMMTGIMGDKNARVYFPLIGSLGVFILVSNLMGMVPGLLPPTSNFNTTVACAVIVFCVTHVEGVRKNGIVYFKHFLGPVPWLIPLMLPLEIVSHLVRPFSLSVRLMCNMTADHILLSVFLGLVAVPLLVPLPVMALGLLVCLVQTAVFCILSSVYVALAVEQHEAHEDHAHPAH